MNYRHAYHAGNHGDVLKHIVLARIIEYLKRKDAPFHVLDVYAGSGVYALGSKEALKTGEWETGIGKVNRLFTPDVEELLKPFRDVIADLNGDDRKLLYYPGSPEIIAKLTRATDRLVFNELHPEEYGTLRDRYESDARIRVTNMDAGALIKASLPPSTRRGLVLIDPPYELKTETESVAQILVHGLKRFASGVFMIWYPVKGEAFANIFCERIQQLGLNNVLRLELQVQESFEGGGLAGSGLLIVNPPYALADEMKRLLPVLAKRLGLGDWGKGLVSWLE